MKYFVIGDEDTVLGFSMVGVKGLAVQNPEEAYSAFQTALETKDTGIIIINERVAELIREQVDQFIFKQEFPLIVEIPDRIGKIHGKGNIREMVNEAIGIKL